MKTPLDLNPNELEELLRYDPQTGNLIWKKTVSRWNKRGQVAGNSNNSRGELEIKLKGKWYKAHHIAWFFITGLWPTSPISHKNDDHSDNSKENLYERFAIIQKRK